MAGRKLSAPSFFIVKKGLICYIRAVRGRKEGHLIIKAPDNVKELHIFEKNLNFPIIIFICTDWEKTQLSYLNPRAHDSESLCRWCISHHIQYQILYPIFKSTILKNPYKYYKYLQMKVRLSRVS